MKNKALLFFVGSSTLSCQYQDKVEQTNNNITKNLKVEIICSMNKPKRSL